jgi:hypothetical protein
LEVRLNRPDIPFIAAEHNNTDNPHTHTIFLMQRQRREMMITSEMLKEFYQQATEIALSQKKIVRYFGSREKLLKSSKKNDALRNFSTPVLSMKHRRQHERQYKHVPIAVPGN